jgi:RNA polymerase sigma factor (sigma-70 family)
VIDECGGTPEDMQLDRLVCSAIARDPEAVRLLWDRQRRWVAAILLAYKPRDADLEDLLQEVAVSFVERIGELREPGAFKPWLRSVAINAARLAGRKRSTAERHRRGFRLAAVEAHQPPAGPDLVAAQREEGRRLLGLAMELPEAYREPLLLRCLHGMSYREISRIVGLPETTIETRIARGRRMVRERAGAQQERPSQAGTRGGVR